MTITKEEFEEWQRDIGIAQQTHPNAFANGPFIRSLFKVSQNIDIAGQNVGHLTRATDQISISLVNFKKVVEQNNRNTENLSRKLYWLNVVLTCATAFGALATLLLLFKK